MTLVLSKKKSPAMTSLSGEEEDLLRRSSKKPKNGSCSIINVNNAEWPSLGVAGKRQRASGLSFAGKVDELTNKEDYLNALTGGPWMIFDHYLTVRPWEPQIRPMRASIDKVAVWIRMPSVFLEYYDREALTWIGNHIGEIIKIDINTSGQLRGLHWLCTNCGRYGHKFEDCKLKSGEQKTGVASTEDTDAAIKPGASPVVDRNDRDHPMSETHDVWKVIQKTGRPKKKDSDKASEELRHGGSRFDVLSKEAEKDVTPPAVNGSSTVLFGVEERSELHRVFAAHPQKLKKNGMKKGVSNKQGAADKINAKVCSKTDLDNDNNTKDVFSKVEEKNDILRSPEATSDVFDNQKRIGQKQPTGVDQTEDIFEDVRHDDSVPISSPSDPDESSKPDGPVGKFWAGPSSLDPDKLMDDDSFEEACESMVPDTQFSK
ncbi:hypothetical protein K1719_031317 [Acacia pycnantha]|nr:hypothetical protein K1719_031317 [Acacia pycnantha]